MAGINRKSMIAELRREIDQRKRVYPRLVRTKKLTRQEMDKRIQTLRAIIAILEAEAEPEGLFVQSQDPHFFSSWLKAKGFRSFGKGVYTSLGKWKYVHDETETLCHVEPDGNGSYTVEMNCIKEARVIVPIPLNERQADLYFYQFTFLTTHQQ